MWTVHLSMRFKEFEILEKDDPAMEPGYFEVRCRASSPCCPARGMPRMHVRTSRRRNARSSAAYVLTKN